MKDLAIKIRRRIEHMLLTKDFGSDIHCDIFNEYVHKHLFMEMPCPECDKVHPLDYARSIDMALAAVSGMALSRGIRSTLTIIPKNVKDEGVRFCGSFGGFAFDHELPTIALIGAMMEYERYKFEERAQEEGN